MSGSTGRSTRGVLVGRLARRIRPDRVAVYGGAGLFLALAAIPFTPALGRILPGIGGPGWFTNELLALLVVLGLLSFGFGLLNISLSTLVSIGASAETQGTAFGVTQGAGSLGRTVGPPVMAALYVIAVPWPFLVGAALVVPVIAVLIVGGARSASPVR